MGPLGWQETIFIFVLALLIFGPKKLPELGKTLGKAMTEFRRASSDLRSTWEREMASVERETESLRQVTTSYSNEIQSSYDGDYSKSDPDYNYGYDSEYDYSGSQDESSTVSASATEGAELTATAGEAKETDNEPAPESTGDQASTGSESVRT